MGRDHIRRLFFNTRPMDCTLVGVQSVSCGGPRKRHGQLLQLGSEKPPDCCELSIHQVRGRRLTFSSDRQFRSDVHKVADHMVRLIIGLSARLALCKFANAINTWRTSQQAGRFFFAGRYCLQTYPEEKTGTSGRRSVLQIYYTACDLRETTVTSVEWESRTG